MDVFAKSLRITGLVLFLAGLAGLLYIFAPLVQQEFLYFWKQKMSANPATTLELIATDDSQESLSTATQKLADFEYGVYVPKIDALSTVIPAIDPTDASEYLPALQKGVALADESYTGETLFLFAHSAGSSFFRSQYNAVFFLLHKLHPGDHFYVKNEGKVLRFEVDDIQIVWPNQVNLVEHSSQDVILMTCYPPGTTLKRLLVLGSENDE